MISLEPNPLWRASYDATAEAIARGATEAPLFAGEDGPARTAALLVSVSFFEARFDPHAHNATDPGGGSFGLFQSSRKPIDGIDAQVTQALGAMRASFKACATRAPQDWMAFYASGSCTNVGGVLASRRRMGMAMKLFKERPFSAPAMVD